MKTAEDMVKEKSQDIVCITPNATIHEALLVMNENSIGAIFIKENDNIIGVWTERDLLRNSIIEGFDTKTAKIKDYMTKDLVSASHTVSLFELKDIFLGRRLRHILIEKDGKYIGLLSVGDVIRASLLEKDKELKDLHAMVSWEYYENWRWKKK